MYVLFLKNNVSYISTLYKSFTDQCKATYQATLLDQFQPLASWTQAVNVL